MTLILIELEGVARSWRGDELGAELFAKLEFAKGCVVLEAWIEAAVRLSKGVRELR